MFKAIIFDCDGVLVDSEVLAMRAERGALAAMGLSFTREEYMRRFIGMHDDAFLAEVTKDFQERLGAAPGDLETRLLDARRKEMKSLTVIEGAAHALRVTRNANYAIAIASSSRAHFLESKMKRTSLWDHAAPHVYSADLVARAKPAPDIFLYAAAQIDVASADCVAIEDSENGVRAAVAAGMTVWGFLGGGHVSDGHDERLAAAGATRMISNHAEFAEIISG